MKLPYSYRTPWQSGNRHSSNPNNQDRELSSYVLPQAQQGVAECQRRCRDMYPDNPAEQVACYRRECW
jgi:hypothetical protein